MEERQPLRPGLGGQPDGVVDGAVTPRRLRLEFRLGVLRVVDQQVDAGHQVERALRSREAAVERLLMVRQVCDRAALPGHSKTQRRAEVWYQTGHHLELADRELGVGGVVKRTVPGNSSTLTGNNGGRIVHDTTSSSDRPSSCAGPYTSRHAPSRNSGTKNGKPCT